MLGDEKDVQSGVRLWEQQQREVFVSSGHYGLAMREDLCPSMCREQMTP